jgi:HAD superfamily hydrolase (TIGR01509 family)
MKTPDPDLASASSGTQWPEGPALVIFDCDGVLVDSEILSGRAIADSLAETGLVMSPEEVIDALVGMDEAGTRRELERLMGHRVPPGFDEGKRRRLDALYLTDLKAFAGIDALLGRLAVPFCVASNSKHARLRKTFAITGLDRLVEGRVFSAEDVARGKPAPDLYLHAANVMGVAPEHCLVVEDSITGATAALAAGMQVVGFVGGSHIRAGHDRQLLALGAVSVVGDVPGLAREFQRRNVPLIGG